MDRLIRILSCFSQILLETAFLRLIGMRRQRPLLIFLLFVSAIAVGPLRVGAQISDSTLVSRFQLAESYLRSAQYQRAIGLLEDLVARSPETNVFYERLRTAYENVKRFEDAIALVDTKIKSESVPTLYLSEKARLVFLTGDEQQAIDVWQQAIETDPKVPGVYLLVYRSVIQVRMFELAIAFLEQGRERLGNSTLFQTDLAYLYGLSAQHDKAMQEYLSLLKTTDEQLNFVRSRLNQFIQDDGALDMSIAEVEDAVATEPLVRSYRDLLGWLYIEAGRFRDAFNVNRAIDQLEEEDGRVLYTFAQVAAEAGAYDVAVEAYKEILVSYTDVQTLPDALRGLGLTHERWAESVHERVYDKSGTSIPDTHYQKALNSYSRFLNDWPNHVFFPDVLRRIGRLQQDVFFDYPAAEAILSEVITRYPNHKAANDAAFDIARLKLVNDDLVSAEVHFSRIVSRLRTGETADMARFELAQIHFYRGEFESALSLVSALQENTSADVSNDAIQLKLLMIENRGPDSLDALLRGFAQAKLLIRQRRTDEALSRINILLEQSGVHPLTDDLRFERAKLLRIHGLSSEALQAYLEIPLIHPDSFFGDRSLFEAADIQANDVGDSSGAIATYSRLLIEYPGSLLVPDTRARIRTLRGDGA
ncbi:MAG: tetratricopeptide repeat protein [Rhodothermia bacterium]|nr:MAG: tetratricopeptide repeat protein [Rhodothermia bacterium]